MVKSVAMQTLACCQWRRKVRCFSVYILPVVVAQFSSHNSAICYILPVLWMTSCFHKMERMGEN